MPRTPELSVLLLAGLALAGCSGNGSPPMTMTSGGRTANGGGSPTATEDSFTILLFTGEPELVRKVKSETQRRTGWRDLRVVREEGRAVLYRGSYRNIEQAQKDLAEVKEVRAPAGHKPFAQAFIVPVPGRDPGPATWQLANADGAYSVCVATFYNVPKQGFYSRKQAAYEYCKQLRDKGQEAYMHHGPSVSTVTIGTFPASSIRLVRTEDRERREIVDPSLERVMERYPVLAVNGMEYWVTVPELDPKTGQPRKVRAKSYPVEIPEDAQSDAATVSGFGNP